MTVITTSLRNAVHPHVRNPRQPRAKSQAELIIQAMVRDGMLPFKVHIPTVYGASALAGLLYDIAACWGASGALAPLNLGGAFSNNNGLKEGQPGFSADAMLRVDVVLRKLSDWERNLLAWLIRAREKREASLTGLGRELYSVTDTDDKVARHVATVRIQALTDSVSQHYPRSDLAFQGWHSTHGTHRRRNKGERRPRDCVLNAAA